MGPPWSTLTAYDLNAGTIRWQVPNGGVTASGAATVIPAQAPALRAEGPW